MFCEIIVQPDTRWPVCPDNGPVIEGRINGYRVFGWYTEKEFNNWLTRRNGSIIKVDGNVKSIIAKVTKHEIAKWRIPARVLK